MKSRVLFLCSMAAFFTTVASVKAVLILPPDDVNEYRIIFTDYDDVAATNTNIEWYNTHITERAELSPQMLGLTIEHDLDWYCLGSTETVDARDNISPSIAWDAENIPIYNTRAELVANNLADLFDGSFALTAGNVNPDQWGDTVLAPNFEVWTGTDRHGVAHSGWVGDGGPLGSASVTMGDFRMQDETWLEWAFDTPTERHYLYGISSPIPEPSTIVLLGMFGLGLFFRRNKFRR